MQGDITWWHFILAAAFQKLMAFHSIPSQCCSFPAKWQNAAGTRWGHHWRRQDRVCELEGGSRGYYWHMLLWMRLLSGQTELNWHLQQKKRQCYSSRVFEIPSCEQQHYLCLAEVRLQWAPVPPWGCPDVRDAALRGGKWERLCVLSELLALQVMLPNQVIFGFHRDAERGQRGEDLWETPPTKDLQAWLYWVRFRILCCSPDTCLPQAGKPTWSPGSKPGAGGLGWCLAQSRACSAHRRH